MLRIRYKEKMWKIDKRVLGLHFFVGISLSDCRRWPAFVLFPREHDEMYVPYIDSKAVNFTQQKLWKSVTFVVVHENLLVGSGGGGR